MLSPFRWLLRSLQRTPKARRVVRRHTAMVESLESRQMLTANIFFEGFEEPVFPGNSGFVANVSSGRSWDDNNAKAHTGSWSGYSADLANGTQQTSYTINMDTTMTKTVDLSDWRDVELSYWRFLNTESGYDTFQVTVSKANVGSVSSTVQSGSSGWTENTLQIPESLWGQSNVVVEFRFSSDFSNVPAAPSGVWVDDISMDGTFDPGFPESKIATPNGINLRLNQFGDISGVNGSITSAGDIDTYGFGVDTPGTYKITVVGTAGLDPQVRVYDAQGNAITAIIDSTGSNGTETVTFNRPSNGEACYFQVGGYVTDTGSYTVSVEGPALTPTVEAVASPTYSVSDSSSIDYSGDRDYYSFTAPLDTNLLSITLNSSANLDGVLILLDSNGNQLAYRDDGISGDVEKVIDFPVTAGTTYVLMVSGYNMSEGMGLFENYSFSIDFNPDNVGKPPSKITVPSGVELRLNQFGDVENVAGSINSTTDYETFAFGVETTGSYTITAGGPGSVDTELRIYDSNGNAITAIKDSAGNAGTETLTVNLTAGQTCYFVVGGYNSLTGNFVVSVDGPSVTVAATPVSGPNYFVSSSDSILNAGDRDYFSLTAPAGTNVLSIVLNPSANLDGVISLFDATGNLLQQKDTQGTGGTETIANFAVTAGQTYFVMFSGYSPAEGSAGAESYSYSFDFGPDLLDVNVAPTIPAGQVLQIAENSAQGTQVGTVVANDANSTAPNNTLTYSILSGSPSNPFTINPNTGLITYTGPGALNFENVPQYTLTVKVTDGGALSATQQVVVAVADVNEAPSITPNQVMQVLENSALDTVVGSVAADDPDTTAPNSTLTYSILSGSPSNPFSINPTTGQITVSNPAALNYETTPQFTLQVKVTDGGNGNLNATQSITINLVDANDAPSIGAGQNFSLPENSSAGTAVGTVAATDPDTTAPNKTLTYSITGGNTGNAFSINPNDGSITVNSAAAIDFEANPSFNLTIQVTDGGNLTASQTVVVNLTNVNEAPTLSGAPIASPTFVGKTKTPVAVFPSITVKDPDGDTELASITINVSIPGGKKTFDIVNLAAAAGVGTVTDQVVNGKHKFTVTLNNGVTTSQVENFLRSITFATSKASLKTVTREFQVSVTDIHGATSNLVTQSVNVKKK